MAFTLPEMAITVAIVFIMVIVVWGVIGPAQLTMDLAVRKSTHARISQQLISEGVRIQNAPNQTEPSPDVFWGYRARIRIGIEQAEVPGSEDQSRNTKEEQPVMSRKVTIDITNGPFPNYDFESGKRHATFATWVSKMAKN